MKSQEKNNLEVKLAICDSNIENNPNDSDTYKTKALILRKLGREERALECLDKAISINPNKPAYRVYKAKLCAEAGNYEQAKIEIAKVDFSQLSNNTHDKHIKNLIRDIQNKYQKLFTINEIDNSKNLIKIEQEKRLESRVGILEKENEELKATVNQLQNSVNKLISLKNYPENVITKESCDSNHLSSNDELVLSLGNDTEHDI